MPRRSLALPLLSLLTVCAGGPLQGQESGVLDGLARSGVRNGAWDVSISGNWAFVGVTLGQCEAFEYAGCEWTWRQTIRGRDGVSADGSRVAVRDPDQPLVRVYRLDEGRWVEEAQLQTWDGARPGGGAYGRNLSLSGDSLAVSQWNDTAQGINNAGAIYVFRREGESWVRDEKIENPDPFPWALLGWGIELDGDVLAASASGDDDSPSRVYVFRREPEGWELEATILPPDDPSTSNFGREIALDGNWLGVRLHTVPLADGDGAIYNMYRRDEATGWEFETELDGSSLGVSLLDARSRHGSVSIDGERVVVKCSDGAHVCVALFRLSGGEWEEDDFLDLQSPEGGFPTDIVMDGPRVVIAADPAIPPGNLAYVWNVEELPAAEMAVSATEAFVGEPVEFDASASQPRRGAQIARYEWSFGDGTAGSGERVSHTYEVPGRHVASLSVIGDNGGLGCARETIVVRCPAGDLAPWEATDVGDELFPGSSRYPDAPGRTLEMCVGGESLGGTSDSFHFVHRSVTGDLDIRARVTNSPERSDAGVMLRESLDPGSPHVSLLLRTSSGLSGSRFRDVRRTSPLGRTADTRLGPAEVPDAWVRIRRTAKEVTLLVSSDGTSWDEVDRFASELPEAVFVGLAGASRAETPPSEAFRAAELAFSDVELTSASELFLRGDCNGDRAVNVSDPVCILNWLFSGGAPPDCVAAVNANGDDAADVSDAGYLLNHLFSGGPAPPVPFPDCGAGSLAADGELGCESGPQACP